MNMTTNSRSKAGLWPTPLCTATVLASPWSTLGSSQVLPDGVTPPPVTGLPRPLLRALEMVHNDSLQLTVSGDRLRVAQIVAEIGPGESALAHSYPGPYLATVLAGVVDVSGPGGEQAFGRNEGWSMLAGQRHALINEGEQPASFVATFLLEEE